MITPRDKVPTAARKSRATGPRTPTDVCDSRDGRFRVGKDAPAAWAHDGLAEMRVGLGDIFGPAVLPRQSIPSPE